MKHQVKLLTAVTAVAVVFGVAYISMEHKTEPLQANASTAQSLQVHVHSDRASYTTIDEMYKASDLVFVGTIEDITKTGNLARDINDPSKEDPNIYMGGVNYQVKVSEFLKGSTESPVIVTERSEVRLRKNEPIGIDDDYISKTKGDTYIFFVAKATRGTNYFGIGNPAFFAIKGNSVEALTNEGTVKPFFKKTDLATFKKQVKDAAK